MSNTEKVVTPAAQVTSSPALNYDFMVDPAERTDNPTPAPNTEKVEGMTWETEESSASEEGNEPKEAPKTEVKPVDETKKSNLAWIKARQERAALKKRIAELESAKTSVAQPSTESALTESVVEARVRAKIEAESKEAAFKQELESKVNESYSMIASDPDINSVPSGLMDILDMVESDPKLAKIHEIDPVLAMTEAKKVWMANKGISKPGVLPVNHTPASRMSGTQDLTTILDKLTNMNPGTKAYNDLYKQYKELTK